jgi:VWFA-related protein
MMLGLTACPHHVEKMLDSMSPPKGYKPSYTTSEVSFKKLSENAKTEQAKGEQTKSSQLSTGAASETITTNASIGAPLSENTEFDPSILSSFPYSASSATQGTQQSKTQGMTFDSSLFAGLGSGKIMDMVKGMNMDSLVKNLPANFPTNLPNTALNLDSLQKLGLPPEVLAGMRKDSSISTPSEAKNSSQKKPSRASTKKASPQKEQLPDTQAMKQRGSDIAEKMQEQMQGQVQEQIQEKIREQLGGNLEQAGSMVEHAQKLAFLYKAKYETLQRQRAEQERNEAEAYKRIAEAEERAAKKLAEKPAIMPITVDIRAINTKKYPDEVELQVSVMDTAGRFITGLAPPHFQGTGNYRAYWRALTDSSSQTGSLNAARVRSFDVVEVREAAQDTHAVAFVLDHSPSMGNNRALRLQEAVARTLGIVKRQDFISVIKFTKSIKVEVPLTNDTNAYRRGFLIDGLEGYGGGTALYDGAMAGIQELKKAPASATKIVVLFSDGGDNSSKYKLQDVYKLAKQEGVRIFTISYGVYDEIEPMQNLASYTGGKLYQLYSAREFPFAFGDVYKSLKNYYRVRYHPVEAASKHAVQLRLAVPELVSVSTATAEYDRSLFTPLDAVGSVQLVNIEFETGKATIQVSSMQQIRDFAAYLKRSPKIVMEVRGHTDDKGADDLNQKLSEARAEAVAGALVQYGASRAQLRTKGFGKTQPLAPNDSEENRRKNRRTEFAIVEK